MFKRLLLFSLFFSLSLGTVGLVQAAEPVTTSANLTVGDSQDNQANLESMINMPTEPGSLVKSGLTPDNFFYPVKLFFENVHTAFTFGHLAKAKRLAFLAEKRMAEAKALTEKKKDKLAGKVLDRYQKVLDNAVTQTDEASKTGQDTTALQEKISKLMEKHLLVLDRVKSQVPEQAKAVIQKVEDRFKVHQEELLKRLAQKNPQEACRLNQTMLRRRLSLLHKAILAQKDKTAEEKLTEWQHYVDLYQNLCQKDGSLSPEALKEIDNQLQALRDVQDQANDVSPALEDALNSIHGKIQQKHLERLKAFEEKHPDKALPLMNEILKKRFTALHHVLAERPTSFSAAKMTRLEIKQISDWLRLQGLNRFGDPQGTSYKGGSPLFDEKTGKSISYFDYLLKKFPNRPWREVQKKKIIDRSLGEYGQYLQIWKKIADQTETNQGEATSSQGATLPGKKIGPQLYQFNNQRLEELKQLYEKLPSEQKEKIGEMIVAPEVLRRRLEKNNPHFQSSAPFNNLQLPEKLKREIKERINKTPRLRFTKPPLLHTPAGHR